MLPLLPLAKIQLPCFWQKVGVFLSIWDVDRVHKTWTIFWLFLRFWQDCIICWFEFLIRDEKDETPVISPLTSIISALANFVYDAIDTFNSIGKLNVRIKLSIVASMPINIRWIRTGSEPYWKPLYSKTGFNLIKFILISTGSCLLYDGIIKNYSSIASKPIDIRWIKTDSEPYWKNHISYRITDIFFFK